jgi:hypothetical protein
MPHPTQTPLILFGAFDRHNCGDLLLAHVAAQRAAVRFPGRPLLFAGVAQRDLRPWGGHRVHAIADLAREWGEHTADLCHVGGELLTCSLYEAAVMVLSPREAAEAIARHDRDPPERQAWAEARLGLKQQAAYLVPKALFRHPGRFTFEAIGGVDLPALPAAMRTEAMARLAEADAHSVRDQVTQAHLAAAGIQASLAPDPGEQVAELFGARIARHAAGGDPAAIRARFPQGYLAVQFSAEFGDDATLRTLAAQLDRVAAQTGLGMCLFRAGAAPWHDDDAVYQRLMACMRTRQVQLFASLHLWDICALLAHAGLYCGSSLHGRIVARAFGVPGISLVRQPQAMSKVKAYCQTWDLQAEASVVGTGDLYPTVANLLGQPGTPHEP